MTRQERELVALLVRVFGAEIVEWEVAKPSAFVPVQQELYDADGTMRLMSVEQQNEAFYRRAVVQQKRKKKSVREIPGQIAMEGT